MNARPDRDEFDDFLAWALRHPTASAMTDASPSPRTGLRCPVGTILARRRLSSEQRLHLRGCRTCTRLARAVDTEMAGSGTARAQMVADHGRPGARTYWLRADESGARLDLDMPDHGTRAHVFVPDADPGQQVEVVIEIGGEERVRETVRIGSTGWATFTIDRDLGDGDLKWHIKLVPQP